jgi:hypothetical protein
MKKLKLDFVDRVKLTGGGTDLGGVLGLARGYTAKMYVCRELYDLIRFSEMETKQMQITPGLNGRSLFAPPNGVPDFGLKDITIEDLWAKVLLDELEAFGEYDLTDFAPASWRERLIGRLKVGGESVTLQGKKKSREG